MKADTIITNKQLTTLDVINKEEEKMQAFLENMKAQMEVSDASPEKKLLNEIEVNMYELGTKLNQDLEETKKELASTNLLLEILDGESKIVKSFIEKIKLRIKLLENNKRIVSEIIQIII